ncbi:MAG: hypothetical protein ACYTEK_26250 [Planctomycetota bacterium]|jgi:hypothetical protein
MDCVTILAQAVETTGPQATEGTVVPLGWFWDQIIELERLEALTFISFGVVCLFYGWRVFKVLVVINFGLLGLVLGMGITQKIVGLNNQLAGGLIGMGVLAVLSVPLMRWAVCILGAAAGGILTSGIWYACGLNEQYIWAGGLIGVVAGGMISFIVFKAAVILFASMWGSGGASVHLSENHTTGRIYGIHCEMVSAHRAHDTDDDGYHCAA